jgi:hypothetical protein
MDKKEDAGSGWRFAAVCGAAIAAVIVFALCAAWLLAIFVGGAHAADAPMTGEVYAQKVKADEPRVKDTKFARGVLLVGVIPTGRQMDGFAEYLCIDAPPAVSVVRVLDAVAAVQGRWRELGYHECKAR